MSLVLGGILFGLGLYVARFLLAGAKGLLTGAIHVVLVIYVMMHIVVRRILPALLPTVILVAFIAVQCAYPGLPLTLIVIGLAAFYGLKAFRHIRSRIRRPIQATPESR
jgi:uncharacterized membrane protein YedE/YeeE